MNDIQIAADFYSLSQDYEERMETPEWIDLNENSQFDQLPFWSEKLDWSMESFIKQRE